jgi:HAE1 family hydrophobic/amphiphilic exporter-1
MARFFIERPILANVLAILFVLIGAVALFGLPVAQYPDVVPPTVQVTARYPGASAQTLLDTVAQPIETAVNGVDGMLYMQSTETADGTYTLTVTFRIGTDLDFAQVLVQNRVASALASLPQSVQAQGVQVAKKSTSILQIITLTSPGATHDGLFLSNYATLRLLDPLSRIPGVGNVTVFGVGQYAMRIWLDPQLLLARGLVPSDVISAIQSQSQAVAGGQIGAPPAPAGQPFQYVVNVSGRLADPAAFRAIVVKSANGAVTRLGDVARVELGAQTYAQDFELDDKAAAGLAIFLTPDANALAVARQVRAEMTRLARDMPPDVAYSVPFDTTRFVSASIDEVWHTLGEAAVLVLVVIMVFLQDWRATLVPATTVPVTIIGAFAFMAALGFTINLSTLFALILAIGIVVDDAIVVVEGVAHHMERGLSAHDAAIKAMSELLGPIIGITLVLMSVFLPAAFLPGLTGRIYAQFALVIAATAFISAINAVTLKPTQCALWLRAPTPPEKRNLFYRGFNAVYGAIERGYMAVVGAMTRHAAIVSLLGVVIIAAAVWSYARLPTAFIPTEDQGYLVVAVQLPQGASLERTKAALERVGAIARQQQGVQQVIQIAGISPLDNSASLASAGAVYVILDDWSQRKPGTPGDLRALYPRLQAALQIIPDGRALVLVPPPIQGIGAANGFNMQVELRDGSQDWARLQGLTDTIVRDALAQIALQHVSTSFRAAAPQLEVDIDRTKAETLGVAVGDIFSAVSSYVGSGYVNQFNTLGRVFQVYVQADAKFRLQPSDLAAIRVRGGGGAMVPLGTLATIRPAVGPSLTSLYNLYPTAGIVGIPAPGFSSGQALDLMDQIAAHDLPPGAGYEWTAMSFQEKAVGGQIYIVFALAMVLVYLCLAGQYESWIAPLGVMFAVPLSLAGPGIVLGLLGLANNLYTQIGVVLLIALSAKNAILIVEVARERAAEGMAPTEAALLAARTRLRPILMTSLAFILGVVPLVLSSGAGAAARITLGLAVLSGMVASTLLAVLFVPSLFVVFERLETRLRKPKPAPVPT